MKKVTLVIAFCLSIFANIFAQTKQESIKTLFHLMQQDSMIDKTFSSVIPAMVNQMYSQMNLDSATTANATEMMKTIMTQTKDICKRMINEDMVAVYDKFFSQDEINDFITFYKTPTGQKMLKLLPEIQKETMKIMMEKYMPELQKLIKEETGKLLNNKE